MPFGIQPLHLIIIALVGLLVFGPGKLPDIGRGVGKALSEFRRGLKDMSEGFQEEVKQPVSQPPTALPTAIPYQTPVVNAPPVQAPTQPIIQAPTQIPIQTVQSTPVQAPATSASVYCTQCGSPNPANARFCNICGSPMTSVPVAVEVKDQASELNGPPAA